MVRFWKEQILKKIFPLPSDYFMGQCKTISPFHDIGCMQLSVDIQHTFWWYYVLYSVPVKEQPRVIPLYCPFKSSLVLSAIIFGGISLNADKSLLFYFNRRIDKKGMWKHFLVDWQNFWSIRTASISGTWENPHTISKSFK